MDKERGFAMFGFLTFGTTMTFLDLACKKQIEEQADNEFPRELNGSKGLVRLYKLHNDGFSFGVWKGKKAVKTVPMYLTSALAGVWLYLMGKRGHLTEKLAVTLTLAGGISNLYDRMKRGYVVDYINIRWKKLEKAVFNLGDVYILLGTLLMAAVSFIDAGEDIWRKRE